MIPEDPDGLYAIASKAARIRGASPLHQAEYEDMTQEGVAWLLEHPGRAWVRAVDGTTEDPEEQLIADLVAHLERTF